MAFAKIHPSLRAAVALVEDSVYYLTSTNEDHTVRSRCGRVRVYWPLSNDEYEAQPIVTVDGVETLNYNIKLAGKKNRRKWSIV